MAAITERSTVSRVTAHQGRPRDPSRADAIRAAVLDLLVEQGYERVTIEAVAARAGAGKATVYRRWRSMEELVLDAVSDLKCADGPTDTGSLAGDLEQLCFGLHATSESRTTAIWQGLASVLPHDTALAAAFEEHFVTPRRAMMIEVFHRAIARGEMPADKDTEMLASIIPSLMMYRLHGSAEPPDLEYLRHIVAEVLLPAATSASARPHPEGALDDR